MDHLQDNFADGGPVSQVPASWFNRVARFINNLVPSDTIRFKKHDDGNATILEASEIHPEETALEDMLETEQVGTESQYNLYFKPPKFDKYGRFAGYGERELLLGGIYAG